MSSGCKRLNITPFCNAYIYFLTVATSVYLHVWTSTRKSTDNCLCHCALRHLDYIIKKALMPTSASTNWHGAQCSSKHLQGGHCNPGSCGIHTGCYIARCWIVNWTPRLTPENRAHKGRQTYGTRTYIGAAGICQGQRRQTPEPGRK